jgi:transmembrane sensor
LIVLNERLNFLFEKKLSNDISISEQLELLEIMADEANESQVNELLQLHWDGFTDSEYAPVFGTDKSDQLLSTILTEHIHPPQRVSKILKLWPRIAAAAAVIIVFSIAWLNLFNNKSSVDVGAYNSAQDILPLKSGATLTLASGKQIKLSGTSTGEVAREAGVIITKAADGKLIYQFRDKSNQSNQTNTISTPKGQTYQVNLPDGSTVLLNAASSLTFSVKLLQQGKRMVKLVGEGYFEVAKDKAHPFIVQGRGQQVEVLGTHFNMNTYADEPLATTTLLEGSVQVTNGKERKKIKPGEQAVSNGATIQILPANVEQIMSWTKGDFQLNHVNFKTAMRDIARWYDVEVVYDASVPDDIESGGWIARDRPLSDVLKSIESSGLVKFKVKDRKVYIMQ